ncbi:transcription elongation factor GreA [Bradyrhizobium sp. BRP22]|uniref:transcription elongation factor GreA n=1 Tax=Bradyrhizobium sp. BRP22 TaxID=2793821 RepID=UPI001CD68C93|nr:transcription elongation factor GreA [Bradyrhizobium sp. BRP22]MCA1457771.1 transcription elongation factor GreA [Bradyrhizobium sp. BRP22]
MSRAFVREGEGDRDDLPDRPISDAPNDVSREGLAQIEAAIATAQAALAAAQAQDDRSAIASASRDLRYWSARRASAHVVAEPDDDNQVRFGHAVAILRDDGRRQTFRIVGEDEADPARGTVSRASPLARALFGRSVGDVVRVGDGEAEILSISRINAHSDNG